MFKDLFPPKTLAGWIILFSIMAMMVGIALITPSWTTSKMQGLPTSFAEALTEAQEDPKNYWFVLCAQSTDSVDEMVIDAPSHFKAHHVPMFRRMEFPAGVLCGVYYRHLPMDEPFYLGFLDRTEDGGITGMWMCMQTVPREDSGPIWEQCTLIPRAGDSEVDYGIHVLAENPNDTNQSLYRLKRQDALAREKTVNAAAKLVAP